jgi:hypothetical protein
MVKPKKMHSIAPQACAQNIETAAEMSAHPESDKRLRAVARILAKGAIRVAAKQTNAATPDQTSSGGHAHE